MKRKFILYPAVALALMTSASLSSCVDTDEPDSLENLRNAVAQEIQANAGLLNAKANVESAYVAVVNATAKKAEADAAEKEYQNIATKAQAELDAQIAQIQMEKNEAVKAQKLDSAKLVYDAAIQDAKKELEKATEGYLAEIEKQKTALLTAQLENQVAIAKLKDNTVGLKDLAEKYTAWEKAQDAVVDDLAAYEKAKLKYFTTNKSRATDSITKVGDIETAQKALEVAKDNLEAAEAKFANDGIDAFAKLWKEYQAKVDGVKAKEDSLKALQTLLTEEKTRLEKAKNDAQTALNNKTAGDKNAPNAVKTAMVDCSQYPIACTNTVLQDLIKDQDLTFKTHDKDGNEIEGTFELNEAKTAFVAKITTAGKDQKVLASDVAAIIGKIKSAFEKVSANVLLQNSETYKALKQKNESNLKDAQDDLGTSDSKAARQELAAAKKDFDKAKDAADVASADADFAAAAKKIFGTYADPTADNVIGQDKDGNDIKKKGDYTQFYGIDFDKDIVKMLETAGYGKIDLDNLGLYGKWKKASEADVTALANKVKTDADGGAKAAQALVDTYNSTLAAANDKAAKAESSDAAKAEKAAFDAAKAAFDAKDKELTAVTNELAPISDQTALNQKMADTYGAYVKALDDKLTTDSYDTYRQFALSTLETEVKKAEATVAEKERALKDFLEGTDEEKAKDLIAAQEKYEASVKAEAKAKAEYEKELAYYGK
jgi:hypothetical protein